MNLALIYSTWNLSFRGAFTFAGLWDDPRGLSGSEVAFVQYARALKLAGHEITLYTLSTDADFEGMEVRPLDAQRITPHDAVISFNDPEPLRHFTASGAFRAFVQYVNSFDYCEHDMPSFVDLFVSPSEPHMRMLTEKAWPLRTGKMQPDPSKWVVVPLACDPSEYGGEKIPGRVVYCSSPDRGLHWVLQEWPAIKRAVPHATLHIYYRLRPWLDQWNTLGYNPALEGLRSRALYIEECFRRLAERFGNLDAAGVTVCDSVSRREMAKALSDAEVLAYPCDTVAWTEGFSCSTLEACAARACPVIFGTDALGHIYRDSACVVPSGDVQLWRNMVIAYLRDTGARERQNNDAEGFAKAMTWTNSARLLTANIADRMKKHSLVEAAQ